VISRATAGIIERINFYRFHHAAYSGFPQFLQDPRHRQVAFLRQRTVRSLMMICVLYSLVHSLQARSQVDLLADDGVGHPLGATDVSHHDGPRVDADVDAQGYFALFRPAPIITVIISKLIHFPNPPVYLRK